MEELYKQLEKLEEKVTKELEKINVKPDMSPTDLKAATDALCLVEKIVKIQNGEDEYSEGVHGSYRGSYGRMRSPRTGRYMSMDRGYSGHSIHDRMVDRLEQMMDEAGSEYERDVIASWIHKIESEQ